MLKFRLTVLRQCQHCAKPTCFFELNWCEGCNEAIAKPSVAVGPPGFMNGPNVLTGWQRSVDALE